MSKAYVFGEIVTTVTDIWSQKSSPMNRMFQFDSIFNADHISFHWLMAMVEHTMKNTEKKSQKDEEK